MTEELLNKKELGIWEVLCIQIARDAKIRRFTVRKVCPGEKANAVIGQLFARALEEAVRISCHTEVSWKRSGI